MPFKKRQFHKFLRLDLAEFRERIDGWPADRRGAYICLLAYQWTNRSIPWNKATFRRVTGLDEDRIEQVMDELEPFFEPIPNRDGKIRSDIRAEADYYRLWRAKDKQSRQLRLNALKAANTRWEKQRAEQLAKERDVKLTVLLEQSARLAEIERDEAKKRANGKPKKVKEWKPKEKLKPIPEAQQYWRMSYGGINKRPCSPFRRSDAIAIAEMVDTHGVEEVKRRMALFINENQEKSTPVGLAKKWDSYNLARTPHVEKVTKAYAERENKARRALTREFGDPATWPASERKRRLEAVTELVTRTLPESDLGPDGKPLKKHYTFEKMLTGLREDKAKNPGFYSPDEENPS